jgi:hypothetical protein
MSSSPSERSIHFVAVALAFVVLAGTSWAVRSYGLSDAAFTASNVLFNVLVFGGAHLYLAARGEGGSVPVDARWRFLAFLGAVAAAALLAVAFGGTVEAAVGVDVRVLGVAFVVVAGLAYLVVEVRTSYRDAMAASE